MKAWQPEGLALMRKNVSRLAASRTWFTDRLREIPGVQTVYPSDANFILVRITNALKVYRRMADLGVVGRFRCARKQKQFG